MGVQEMLAAARYFGSPAFNVGYDQGQRWTFFNRETNVSSPNKETDCSSLSGAIAKLGGYNVDLSDPFYTGTFESRLKAAGFQSINVRGWGSSRLYSTIEPGDFVLGPGHVVFAISRTEWLSAEGDERGRRIGGRAGDNIGSEVRIRRPYMRSKGWTCILRARDYAEPLVAHTEAPKPDASFMALKAPAFPLPSGWYFGPKKGPKHSVSGYYGHRSDLRRWQTQMKLRGWALTADGYYGPQTEKITQAFQREKGLEVDGKIGPITWKAAWEAPVTP